MDKCYTSVIIVPVPKVCGKIFYKCLLNVIVEIIFTHFRKNVAEGKP